MNGTNDTANRFSPQSDRTEHPWCNRRNFSTLAFNERNRIDEILDKMLTLIKEWGDCIVGILRLSFCSVEHGQNCFLEHYL
jgi:hypothetical protein